MPLDPQIRAMLDKAAASGIPPFHQLPVETCRKLFAQVITALPQSTQPIAGSRDLSIDGPGGRIPLRVFQPIGTGPFPVLVFSHGGGWVVGDVAIYNSLCRELCGLAGCVVVSVDYRLAPEHKFPAAADDCAAATRWVHAHAAGIGADPRRVVVGGDSAGGNLAAATALRLRDEGGPALSGQLLVYPATDHYSRPTVSMVDNAQGYGLSAADMAWFTNHYLAAPADIDNPYANPLRAASLAGLPPALVITAEYDPLRDEGEAYARALQRAGVATQLSRYDGANHGFFSRFGLIDLGRVAIGEACGWLKQRFA
ncbi:MAG: alpha/beta hydrolase [Nevskia sp.]|nr:alpha/beta hydrolase [Nevskia sp.]